MNYAGFVEHCDCALVRAELKEAAAHEKARRKAEGLDSDDEDRPKYGRGPIDVDEQDEDACASIAVLAWTLTSRRVVIKAAFCTVSSSCTLHLRLFAVTAVHYREEVYITARH